MARRLVPIVVIGKGLATNTRGHECESVTSPRTFFLMACGDNTSLLRIFAENELAILRIRAQS